MINLILLTITIVILFMTIIIDVKTKINGIDFVDVIFVIVALVISHIQTCIYTGIVTGSYDTAQWLKKKYTFLGGILAIWFV